MTTTLSSSLWHDVKWRLVKVKTAVFFCCFLSFPHAPTAACAIPVNLCAGPQVSPAPNTQNRDMWTVNHLAAWCRIFVESVCPWGGEERVKGGLPGSVLL